MEVFALKHFRISLISLREEEYLNIYRESLRKYIVDLSGSEIEQKFSILELLLGIVNSYICLL